MSEGANECWKRIDALAMDATPALPLLYGTALGSHPPGDYLFVWAGDSAAKASDFLG
jgi:hypothetical protein